MNCIICGKPAVMLKRRKDTKTVENYLPRGTTDYEGRCKRHIDK